MTGVDIQISMCIFFHQFNMHFSNFKSKWNFLTPASCRWSYFANISISRKKQHSKSRHLFLNMTCASINSPIFCNTLKWNFVYRLSPHIYSHLGITQFNHIWSHDLIRLEGFECRPPLIVYFSICSTSSTSFWPTNSRGVLYLLKSKVCFPNHGTWKTAASY